MTHSFLVFLFLHYFLSLIIHTNAKLDLSTSRWISFYHKTRENVVQSWWNCLETCCYRVILTPLVWCHCSNFLFPENRISDAQILPFLSMEVRIPRWSWFLKLQIDFEFLCPGWSFFRREAIRPLAKISKSSLFGALRWNLSTKRRIGTRLFLNPSAQSTVLFIPMALLLLPVIIVLLSISAPLCSSKIDGEFIFAGNDHPKLGHKKQFIKKRGGFVFRVFDHGKDR